MRFEAPDTGAMEAFGRELGGVLRAGDVVVLTGPLGAGKTTLTRGIGAGLGIRGPVQSPTFVLARTHPSLVGGAPLVHVDAYRLGSAALLEDLDLDFDRSVVVVEWGAGLVEDVTDSWLEIVIERPTGARAVAGRAADAAGGEPVDGDASPDADAVPDADASPDADAALDADEPRTVTATGHGPRWADTPYAARA